MPKKRSWTDEELADAVSDSNSIRAVLIKLNLIPAGGNYHQINTAIGRLGLDTSHFTGKAWNKGMTYSTKKRVPIAKLLAIGTTPQSYKLKKRLYDEGLKIPACEICGWAQIAQDGRIPLELDHINGDRYDNRLENLRILCPNCHSLQPTHRGKNKKNLRR